MLASACTSCRDVCIRTAKCAYAGGNGRNRDDVLGEHTDDLQIAQENIRDYAEEQRAALEKVTRMQQSDFLYRVWTDGSHGFGGLKQLEDLQAYDYADAYLQVYGSLVISVLAAFLPLLFFSGIRKQRRKSEEMADFAALIFSGPLALRRALDSASPELRRSLFATHPSRARRLASIELRFKVSRIEQDAYAALRAGVSTRRRRGSGSAVFARPRRVSGDTEDSPPKRHKSRCDRRSKGSSRQLLPAGLAQYGEPRPGDSEGDLRVIGMRAWNPLRPVLKPVQFPPGSRPKAVAFGTLKAGFSAISDPWTVS